MAKIIPFKPVCKRVFIRHIDLMELYEMLSEDQKADRKVISFPSEPRKVKKIADSEGFAII